MTNHIAIQFYGQLRGFRFEKLESYFMKEL